MWNFVKNLPQTLILFKIASAILAMKKYLEGAVIETINNCSLQLFLRAKITEAILNRIKVNSRYHEN